MASESKQQQDVAASSEQEPLVDRTISTDDNVKRLLSQHEQVLSAIESHTSKCAGIGVSLFMCHYLRAGIIVLYMRTFYDDITIISIVVSIGTLVSGVNGLLFGYIGDNWRFDHLLILSCIIDVICYFFQAAAWSFTIFSIFYIIGTLPLGTLTLGYVARLLPINSSKKVLALLYQFRMTTMFFAQILGAICAYYISYRFTFYLVAITSLLLLIYCIKIYNNKQIIMENMELSLYDTHYNIRNIKDNNNISYQFETIVKTNNNHNNNKEKTTINNQQQYEMYMCKWMHDEEYGFPICLEKQNKEMRDSRKNDNNNNNNDKQFLEEIETNMSSLTRKDYVLLTLTGLQNAFVDANIVLFDTYYTVYMYDQFDCNIIISTSQLIVSAMFMAFGMRFIGYINKKYPKNNNNQNHNNTQNSNNSKYNYDFKNKWVLFAICGSIICIIILTLLFTNELFGNINGISIDNDKYLYLGLYWVYQIIYGFTFGCVLMSQEFIVLETQPKLGTGTMTGLRSFFHSIFIALGCVVIGIYWDYSYQCIFYYAAFYFALCILAVILFVIIAQKM